MRAAQGRVQARRVGKTWRSDLEERPSGREDGRKKMEVCRRGCYETRLRRAKHSAAFETGCRRFEQEKQNGWLKLIVWRVEPSTARSRVRLPCASGCRP